MCMLRTNPIKFKPEYSFSFIEFFLPGRDSNPDCQIPRKLAYQLTNHLLNTMSNLMLRDIQAVNEHKSNLFKIMLRNKRCENLFLQLAENYYSEFLLKLGRTGKKYFFT